MLVTKAEAQNAVEIILKIVNEMWSDRKNIDVIVEMIRVAKQICYKYGLDIAVKVADFGRVICREYGETKAEEAEKELSERMKID